MKQLLIIFLLVCSCSFATDFSTELPAVKSVIKKLYKAVKNNDIDKILTYMPLRSLRISGNRLKMVQKDLENQLKDLEFIDLKISSKVRFHQRKNNLGQIAVVPVKITYKKRNTTYLAITSKIIFRPNTSSRWKVHNGDSIVLSLSSRHTSDDSQVRVSDRDKLKVPPNRVWVVKSEVQNKNIPVSPPGFDFPTKMGVFHRNDDTERVKKRNKGDNILYACTWNFIRRFPKRYDEMSANQQTQYNSIIEKSIEAIRSGVKKTGGEVIFKSSEGESGYKSYQGIFHQKKRLEKGANPVNIWTITCFVRGSGRLQYCPTLEINIYHLHVKEKKGLEKAETQTNEDFKKIEASYPEVAKDIEKLLSGKTNREFSKVLPLIHPKEINFFGSGNDALQLFEQVWLSSELQEFQVLSPVTFYQRKAITYAIVPVTMKIKEDTNINRKSNFYLGIREGSTGKWQYISGSTLKSLMGSRLILRLGLEKLPLPSIQFEILEAFCSNPKIPQFPEEFPLPKEVGVYLITDTSESAKFQTKGFKGSKVIYGANYKSMRTFKPLKKMSPKEKMKFEAIVAKAEEVVIAGIQKCGSKPRINRMSEADNGFKSKRISWKKRLKTADGKIAMFYLDLRLSQDTTNQEISFTLSVNKILVEIE